MHFKGITQLGQSTITNDVINNVISFFDYGLIESSGYLNITIPTTGYYGGTDSTLRPVNDPRYPAGKIWISARKNWVYETGLTPEVYVNNVLNTDNQIHYPFGSVIFNTPISTSSAVTAQYSYKYVNVTRVEGLNWFEQVHMRSQRSDGDFPLGTGIWQNLAENRFQLPAIGVELKSRNFEPWQIGGGQKTYTDLLIHCVAEDAYTRDMLFDIVSLQNDKRFVMYDLNAMAEADAFPLKNGFLHSGLSFPSLVNNFPYKVLRLFDVKADRVYSLGSNLHIGTIRCKTEVYLGV